MKEKQPKPPITDNTAGPDCPYCGNPSTLWRWGEHTDYPYQTNYGRVWGCAPCGAWVGCHQPSKHTNYQRGVPLGRLANKELRELKKKAHDHFDPLWRIKAHREGISRGKARRLGYKWLAQQLGVPEDQCHIGEFDEALCRRVIDLCPRVGVNRGKKANGQQSKTESSTPGTAEAGTA